jgi:hypothetical protein
MSNDYDVMRIDNLDQLLVYAAMVISKNMDFRPIKFGQGDFTYSIKIVGPSWDGSIDCENIKYLKSIFRAFNKLTKHVYPDKSFDKRSISVRIKVTNGCTKVVLDLKNYTLTMEAAMTSTQSMICFGSLCNRLDFYYS